jgi:hypothetical protein
MAKYYKYFIWMFLIVIPATVNAYQPPPSDKVKTTMRYGQPCFYHLQDKSLSFGYLAISTAGEGQWEIQISPLHRKKLLEPNNPATCIRYGVLNPGMELIRPAKPLRLNVPYEVFMDLSDNRSYQRKYASNFCLTQNIKGETILVNAAWDEKKQSMICLKQGETPKRGFWQKLFGK